MAKVSWPKLPRIIQGAGGPIRVVFARVVKSEDGKPAWGTWEGATRMVRIVQNQPRHHQWRILFHELTHAAIEDAGLDELFSEEGNEALCKALASARVSEFAAQVTHGTPSVW